MAQPTASPAAPRYVGAPVRRKEDPRLLRGEGVFVGDVSMPGLLHAAFLRSPHAHARLRGVDLDAARRLPGVVAALAYADIADVAKPLPMLVPHKGLRARMNYPLARDKVRFVGEAIAIVVAADPYLAEDALELIQVDYEILPAVASAEQALAPGAPLLHDDADDNLAAEWTHGVGDVERAFAEADLVVEESFRVGRISGQPMEPRGCLARWDSIRS
jgi:CO/xanthine dehydrogenase Mo-binding subunit